jgi:hypothetical protein
MNTIIHSVLRLVSGRLLPKIPYQVLMGPLKGSKIILGGWRELCLLQYDGANAD